MTLHLPAAEVPAVIRESTRCVLKARGFKFFGRDGQELSPEDVEGLLRELGNNVAQALYSIDSNLENH